MKKFKIIVWCGLVLFPLLTFAQNGKINSRIGIEMGYHEFFGNTIVPDRVRSVKSVEVYETGYYGDYYGGYENKSDHTIDKAYIGIKYEALFLNNNIGISSGLRFSQLSATLDHSKKYNSFIWLLHQEEQTSDYLTIRSIKQKNYYASVPLEIRIFPKRNDRFFKTYFKIGGALNYRFSTNYNIDFLDNEMERHAKMVESQIDKPCTFSGFVFPAFGFRWGKNNYPWVNVEFQFPGFIIAERKHAFVDPNVGFGIQFSIQIPLKKTI